tara:strand:- start:213 stop:572 length:360 start_codon:yes stop_codon:yes gene_type:complete
MDYKDIIEAIYIIYMYNYFKTTISIHHPFEYLINKQSMSDFIKHPVDSGFYENKICPLGNMAGWLLGIWVIIRGKLDLYNKEVINKINKVFFILLLVLSLVMNLNAFIYMIPVFIYELT